MGSGQDGGNGQTATEYVLKGDAMTKQIMTLTDAAVERVKALMAQSNEPVEGIRVGVRSGGCSGMSYYVEYAQEPRQFEEVIEEKGVRIFVEPTAVMYLIGCEMDYKEDKIQSGFTFNNPNETARCGCGKSFHVN